MSQSEPQSRPIFIIGGNRSGTSLMSHLVAQHPDVEGLFHDDGFSPTEPADGSHMSAYCESGHLWARLNRSAMKKVAPKTLFALPENIGFVYRTRPSNDREARKLRNAILDARRTELVPLIKDNLNVLRIGLIKALFPAAKFVHMVRRHDTYIPSNRHKWANDFDRLEIAVGLHWYLANAVAAYDLERFAPRDYFTVAFEDLVEGDASASAVMSDVYQFLELADYGVDLSAISAKYQFDASSNAGFDVPFSVLTDLVRYEREIGNL